MSDLEKNKWFEETELQDSDFDSYENQDLFRWKVSDLLEWSVCPNCGQELQYWKCIDKIWCWFGHGDDYFEKESVDKAEKAYKHMLSGDKMKWNWKEYPIATHDWKIVSFYNHFWNIHLNTANLKIWYDNNVYKINVEFNLVESEDYQETWTDINRYKLVSKSSIEIKPPIKIRQYNKSKSKHEWKKVYFDYSLAKKIANLVLNDIRFNKYLEINN